MNKEEIKKRLYVEDVGGILPSGDITVETLTLSFQKRIDELKKMYPEFTDIRMNFEYIYGYYDSCEYTAYFTGYRLETDDEYLARMNKNKKISESNAKAYQLKKIKEEENEKALFEKLKKKYNN